MRLLLALCLCCCTLGAAAVEHGVILLYHRVSDSGPGATRVTPERFAAHLDLLQARNYRVLPLAELLAGVYGDDPLPARAVAITFDDAYRSVADAAWPLLAERDLPFTVFVATDVVDAQAADAARPRFLDWETMREMQAGGLASFAPHSLSHAHLEARRVGESPAERNRRLEREIAGSLARLRGELGDGVLPLFAYPYGEYSRETEALVSSLGLRALAQQSGAVGPATPATRIPRFPLYTGGDGDERLLTAVAARPLPVAGEEDERVYLAPDAEPPRRWRLRPAPGPYQRPALRCYAASGAVLEQHWDGDWLAVTLPPWRPGRNKVNCTAPAADGDGYFWHSRLWLRADRDGSWLTE